MAWRDKPKTQRFSDIGAIVGVVIAIIATQFVFNIPEFWMRVALYVVGLTLGRLVGTKIAERS